MVNLRVVTVVALPPRATIHMARDEICFSSTQEKIGDRKKVLRMRGGEEQGKEWKEKEKNSGKSYGEYISPRAIGQRYPPYSTFDHNLSLQGRAARKIHPPRWLFDPICRDIPSGFSASFVTI